tara:strand:+ start:862 stop:1056 length:195 start_codon:yes stop_codon:yes gene_type:complete
MRPNSDWVKYSNIGFQIIVTLVLFGWIGYFLDNKFSELQPLFLILMLLIGAAIALYYLWISVFK